MPDQTDNLEAPDNWDWEAGVAQPGLPDAPVTVSVKYSAAEFDAIAECAEREGLSVTDFVRRAALEAATGRRSAR